MMRTIFARRFFLLFIFTLVVCTGCASRQVIVTDLQEKDANEILQFLASKGIVATKTEQAVAGGAAATSAVMWTIQVPNAQAIEAISILNNNGLPRRPGVDLLTLFQKSGLVSTDKEEQIRYQQGLAEQIANTIRQIDGVLDAYVQLSIPDTENALGQTIPGIVRASVYVKHQGILDNPNSQLVTKIKRLVAASVNGLTFDNVTVISDRSRFTETTFEESPSALPEEQKEYVSIWGIIIGKDSASSFRSLFFFLCLLILLLTAIVAWLIWKLFPVLQQSGGFTQLINGISPLEMDEHGRLQKKAHKKKGAEGEEESGESDFGTIEAPAPVPPPPEEEETL